MLDEATSSLDAETEHRITTNVGEKFRGSTRVVIAHRLSTVRDADFIVVMRGGRVVETGTHSELIAREGIISPLVRNQLELPAELYGEPENRKSGSGSRINGRACLT